jgi:hypothetical protein
MQKHMPALTQTATTHTAETLAFMQRAFSGDSLLKIRPISSIQNWPNY